MFVCTEGVPSVLHSTGLGFRVSGFGFGLGEVHEHEQVCGSVAFMKNTTV